MPEWMIPRLISAVLLCSMIVAPFVGCSGKRVGSSGDEASSSKAKTAGAPVETIKPETLATVPDEKTASPTAREPVIAAPPNSGAASGVESSPPDSLSAPAAAAPFAESPSLGDVFFDFDQYTIRKDAQLILSANADWINSRSGKAVVIEGHCDERGTQAYNLVLGDKRARSTKRFLEDLGVPASRLKTTSYGELRPFCKERDESCYQQNRRAHFVIQ